MSKKNDQKMIFGKVASSPGSTLKALLTKAELHQQAEQLVLDAVPEELADGTRFVSCTDGELVLVTDNASKATRLRCRQHEVMEKLRERERMRLCWEVGM